MVNLRVINDLNNRRTQGNIQTLKGKQIKTEVLDMMYKLFSSLVENFGFEKLAGGLGAVFRTWEKEVDVAWCGKSKSIYKVVVHPWAGGDAVKVSFMKNGKLEKQKIYSSSPARTINAIKSTVEYADFEF